MTQLLDLLERAGWTFIQAFSASVVVTNGLGRNDFKIAFAAAGIAVFKTLAINANVGRQLDVLKGLTKAPRKR